MNTTSRKPNLTRALLASLAATALIAGQAGGNPIDINAWKLSNEYRAMKLQRELAGDMPQDQALQLGSHNSYNSSAYGAGYPLPQHSYTLSQQLDLGLRALDLDIHVVPVAPGDLQVTHATCGGFQWVPGDLTLALALQEIRGWLDANPDEVIVLNFEQHFPMTYPSGWHTRLITAVEQYLGAASGNDRLIRPSEFTRPAWDDKLEDFAEMSLNQLRALGRVMVINIGGVTAPCSDDGHYTPDHPVQNVMFGNAPSFTWCGAANWQFITADEFIADATQWYWGGSAMGSRIRTNCLWTRYTFLYNNTSDGQYDSYGSASPAYFREAIRAGHDAIRLDPVGRSNARPFRDPIEFPADEQMRATIWSWDYRFVAPVDGMTRAGMAVVDGDTARIRWEAPTADMRYAIQDSNGRWGISDSRGAYTSTPPSLPNGWNFRAPGNGFEMQNLFGAMVRAGITRVWINYHDLDGDGAWNASTQKRRFTNAGMQSEISPKPVLIDGPAQLVLSQNTTLTPQHPRGLVFSVYPSAYPGPARLSNPGTIVPWAPGVSTVLGR